MISDGLFVVVCIFMLHNAVKGLDLSGDGSDRFYKNIMSYVIEPFESVGYTDKNGQDIQWFGVPIETSMDQTSKSNFTIVSETNQSLFGKASLRIDYSLKDVNDAISFGWIQSNRSHNCYKSDTFSIWYKHNLTNEQQQQKCQLKIRLVLYDDSACLSNSKMSPTSVRTVLCNKVSNLNQVGIVEEIIESSIITLDDNRWIQIRVPTSHFPQLNLKRIRGWKLEMMHPNPLDKTCSGTVWFDQLECQGSGEMFGSAFHVVDTNIGYSMNDAAQDGTWNRKFFKSNISEANSSMVLNDSGSLSFNYTVEQVETWGGYLAISYVAPGTSYYNLSSMSFLSFDYEVLESESAPGRSMFRVVLLDGSHCNETCSHSDEAQERYYSFHSILSTNSTKQGQNTITVPFAGGTTPQAPFWLTGWSGISGNSILDLGNLKGIYLEVNINAGNNSMSIGSFDSGAFVVSNLTAKQYTSINTSTNMTCVGETNLGFTVALNSFRNAGNLGAICHSFCVDDQTCNYAISDVTGHCYVADSIFDYEIKLYNSSSQDTDTLNACWVDSASKRGDFCTKCKCNPADKSIDCRGTNLLTVPKTFDQSFRPRLLDLRDNPQLVIIGSGALNSVASSLEELLLPMNLTYIASTTLKYLNPDIKIVSDTSKNGQRHASNVVTSTKDSFQDVCCTQGNTLSIGSIDFTFCDLKANFPGVDSVYENFVEYYDAGLFKLVEPSSSFMSEAAESYQKCAEYCAITQQCNYFSYDGRILNTHSECYLWETTTPIQSSTVCCESDHYADENQTIADGYLVGHHELGQLLTTRLFKSYHQNPSY
jgi:hypothetical protein